MESPALQLLRNLPTLHGIASSAATQKIANNTGNLMINYRVCNSPPLVINLGQIIQVCTNIILWFHLNTIYYLRFGFSNGLFLPGFPTEILNSLLFPIRATGPVPLSLIHLTIKRTNHEALRYAVFTNLQTLHQSLV
jgi:hypothetical protein